MERSKDEIIEQLWDMVKHQSDVIDHLQEVAHYWRCEAMDMLERDIEATISRQSDGLPGEWLESVDD